MKAVVFIDVQYDFVNGIFGSEHASHVAEQIMPFARKCADNGWYLYGTRDTHKRNYLQTLEGQKLPIKHCIEGTNGWKILTELNGILDDAAKVGLGVVYDKHTFGSKKLVEVLELAASRKGIDEIILCGFCTDICVISNALMLRAALPNTKITVMKNLCAGTTKENHEAALKVMTSCQIDVV